MHRKVPGHNVSSNRVAIDSLSNPHQEDDVVHDINVDALVE